MALRMSDVKAYAHSVPISKCGHRFRIPAIEEAGHISDFTALVRRLLIKVVGRRRHSPSRFATTSRRHASAFGLRSLRLSMSQGKQCSQRRKQQSHNLASQRLAEMPDSSPYNAVSVTQSDTIQESTAWPKTYLDSAYPAFDTFSCSFYVHNSR